MSRKNYKKSRRDFLKNGMRGLAGVALLPSFFKEEREAERGTDAGGKEKIIYRTLGKTEIRLPIVNMGVMNAFNSELIKRSYDTGVRHFDTAAWYGRGRSEESVGNAIKELNVRDNVIIGTKVYIPLPQRNITPEQAKETYLRITDESLQRLQTGYVDILYSHVVQDIDWLNNPGILEALQLLKKQGKARFIGFSTHQNMAECIRQATKDGYYDVILTAFNYAMGDDKELIDALKNAYAKGIGLVAMKTLCAQYWYREHVPSDKLSYYKGKIMHTAVLKWALRNDFIATAIPGYTTFQQMEEDFSVAYDLEYTPEEKRFLKDRVVKLSLGYCSQCQQCLSTCPKDVDIPTLMRTHMYAACYTNFYQARDTLDEIPRGKGLDACVSCETCRANCVNSVDIPRRIDELKVIYA